MTKNMLWRNETTELRRSVNMGFIESLPLHMSVCILACTSAGAAREVQPAPARPSLSRKS